MADCLPRVCLWMDPLPGWASSLPLAPNGGGRRGGRGRSCCRGVRHIPTVFAKALRRMAAPCIMQSPSPTRGPGSSSEVSLKAPRSPPPRDFFQPPPFLLTLPEHAPKHSSEVPVSRLLHAAPRVHYLRSVALVHTAGSRNLHGQVGVGSVDGRGTGDDNSVYYAGPISSARTISATCKKY